MAPNSTDMTVTAKMAVEEKIIKFVTELKLQAKLSLQCYFLH